MIKKSQVKNDLLETERWEQSEAFALLDRSILQCLSQIIWVFSLFAMSSIFNFFFWLSEKLYAWNIKHLALKGWWNVDVKNWRCFRTKSAYKSTDRNEVMDFYEEHSLLLCCWVYMHRNLSMFVLIFVNLAKYFTWHWIKTNLELLVMVWCAQKWGPNCKALRKKLSKPFFRLIKSKT